MTASERTFLLSHRRHPYFDNDNTYKFKNENNGKRNAFAIALILGVVVVMAVFQWSCTSTNNNKSHSVHTTTSLDESELLQWDDWKNDVDHAKTWLGGVVENVPKVATKVQGQLQADSSQLTSWWDGTADSREEFIQKVSENAERFGNQVKTWWGDASTSSERAIHDADIQDKVAAIENNFQNWWNKASNAERLWWNATESQINDDDRASVNWIKQNGGVIAQRGGEWLDLTKSKLAEEEETIANFGKTLLNASEANLENDATKAKNLEREWVDSADKTIKSDGITALNLADKWWNSTAHAVEGKEKQVSKLGQGMLDTSKEILKSDKAIALKAGSDWLNATEEALHGEGLAITQSSRNWLTSAKSALNSERAVIEDDERVLQNKTLAMLDHETNDIKSKFALWWTTMKSIEQEKLRGASDAEEAWWNATEYWLRNRLLSKKSREMGNVAAKALLYLNNSYAYSLLMNGYHWYDFSNDFFLLQGGWDVQVNQAYCSVASAAAVINSFRPFGAIPVDPMYSPYEYATQENLFNDCVQDTVIRRNDTFDGLLAAPGGLSLDQLYRFMICHDLNATIHYVNPINVTMDEVRQQLEEALMNPTKRVIVNFDRQSLGQVGGGHFSPLGSYSKKDDSFLLMDVAKYKYPPVWIPTERLYISLATEDGCGVWDYPKIHDKLQNNIRIESSGEFKKIMRLLKCHKMHRGFVIVQLTR